LQPQLVLLGKKAYMYGAKSLASQGDIITISQVLKTFDQIFRFVLKMYFWIFFGSSFGSSFVFLDILLILKDKILHNVRSIFLIVEYRGQC
jgi:hypothetical protein